MNTFSKTLLVVPILSAIVAGCRTGPDYYDVEMTPQGAGVLRTISRDFGPEDFEAMAALYGVEPYAYMLEKFENNATLSRDFTGTFVEAMPNDNNSAGTLLFCESPFGSVSWYSERFGGFDDIASTLEDQEAAFNAYWDLLLRGLEFLAGKEPGFADVRRTLDSVVRRDAWNIALTLSMVDMASDTVKNLEVVDDDEENDVLMRLVHLLDARGYIEIDKILDYMSRIDDSGAAVFEIIGTAIGRKMGLPGDGPIPPVFRKLASLDDEEIMDAIDRFIEAEGGEDQFFELANRAFRFDQSHLAYGGDLLRVRLYISVEPFWTNGHWNEDPGSDEHEPEKLHNGPHVSWSYPLASTAFIESDLPHIVYAQWAEPAHDYQETHLGLIVMTDYELDEFCQWRRGLTTTRMQEWDAFVESLSANEDIIETLKAFHFSDETPRTATSDESPGIRSSIAYHTISSIVSKIEDARKKSDQ